jgi:hypothetical protein
MTKLPESFCIQRDADNPLWGKYIDWLNKKYDRCFEVDSSVWAYYGVWEGVCSCELNTFDATIITLEQWDAIVNPKPEFKVGDYIICPSAPKPKAFKIMDIGDDIIYLDGVGNIVSHYRWNEFRLATPEEIDAAFELPEKWCVIRNKENHEEVNNWFNQHTPYHYKFSSDGTYSTDLVDYLHYPSATTHEKYLHDRVVEGYTLLSYDQFKKYVLKENTMEKKIIGYKFKLDAYNVAAIGLYNKLRYTGNVSPLPLNSEGFHFPVKSNMETFLIKEDLLERWTEPVYEKSSVINIKSEHNNYEIKVSNDDVEVNFGTDLYAMRIDIIQQLSVLINRLEDYKIAGHNVKIDSISIGCQKNIPVSELKKVFKVVDNLK